MSKELLSGKVTSVTHWTPDGLFSFKMEKPRGGYNFVPGQFVMIGLPDDTGKPIMRAYSIVSPPWADELEFLSIKVANGPLTSRLKNVKVGDDVLLGGKPTGTLVHSNLTPGKNLFLIGTGTGLAPWLSIIRDPGTYEKYEHVYVVHGVRHANELAYRDYLEKGIYEETIPDPDSDEVYQLKDFLGVDDLRDRLTYYPTVTREDFKGRGKDAHIPDQILSGEFFKRLGLDQTAFNPEVDRVMVCGSVPMNKSMKALCEAQGMTARSKHEPGAFVDETAFVGEPTSKINMVAAEPMVGTAKAAPPRLP